LEKEGDDPDDERFLSHGISEFGSALLIVLLFVYSGEIGLGIDDEEGLTLYDANGL
jgi:hypothetical protein